MRMHRNEETQIESKWFMPTGYRVYTLACECVGDDVLLVGVKFYDYYYDFGKQNIRLFFVICSGVFVSVLELFVARTGCATQWCIDDFCEMCLRVRIFHTRFVSDDPHTISPSDWPDGTLTYGLAILVALHEFARAKQKSNLILLLVWARVSNSFDSATITTTMTMDRNAKCFMWACGDGGARVKAKCEEDNLVLETKVIGRTAALFYPLNDWLRCRSLEAINENYFVQFFFLDFD